MPVVLDLARVSRGSSLLSRTGIQQSWPHHKVSGLLNIGELSYGHNIVVNSRIGGSNSALLVERLEMAAAKPGGVLPRFLYTGVPFRDFRIPPFNKAHQRQKLTLL